MAASRATRRQRSTTAAARSPVHRTTDRAATRGTIRSTPSSVSFCTAHSGRSPFTGENATVTRGVGAGSTTTSPSTSNEAPPTHRHATHRPAPSDAVTASPTRSRSTRSRWWRSPVSNSGADRSGTKTCATAPATAAAPT